MNQIARDKLNLDIVEKKQQLKDLIQEIKELEALLDVEYECGGVGCHRCTQFPNFPLPLPPQVS